MKIRPGADESTPRVLIVDDDPALRSAVLVALDRWPRGYRATTRSRAELLPLLHEDEFDVVLLDCGPSDAAGLELLGRAGVARPDTPVIMVSRHGDEQWAVHAIQAGAADYVPSRHIDTVLVRAIDLALERVRHARDLEMLNLDLVGMVSHDIRAPASNIVGFADLLLTAPGGPTGASQLKLERIRQNGYYILKLIDDMIDMVRIECGELRLTLGRHDVGDLVRESVDRCAFFAETKSIRVEVVPPSPPEVAVLDRAKIMQALTNLISNAIKFSNEGAAISVRASARARRLHFRVEDDGLGIAAAEIPNLFKRFSRTSTRATGGEKGSGLGLYIVREFTELHGGAVAVESEPGRGSAFTISLPQDRAAIP